MNSRDQDITVAPNGLLQPSTKRASPGGSSDSDDFTHNEHTHNSPSPPSQNYDGRTLTRDGTADTYRTYEEHGILIDGDQDDAQAKADYEHHKHLWWFRFRYVMADAFSEFCGTMIMIIFGDGSVAQVLLSANPKLPVSSQNKGTYQSISWGWGIGVMLGIYVAGKSGGHLNPAVTFANCLFRGLAWWKWPIYACAQVTGCFCGAAIIYGNYKSAIDAYEGYGVRTVPGYSDTATAGVFCTYPQPFITKTGQVFSEIIASAVLIFCIFALKDGRNLGADNLVPLMLFFLIFGIGATLGWETGYAINLARDFGPRLFSYFVGYGNNVWKAGDYYFWVPMICPFIGGTFGGFLYDLLMYTGKSPINTPWFGIKTLVRPDKEKFIKVIKEGDAERAV